MKRLQAIWVLLAATLSVSAWSQTEAVLTKRATELRDAPSESGRTLAPLAAETQLTRLPTRQGAWIQVRLANGTTGWVHMFDLGSASAPSNTATSALRGLSNFFGGGNSGAKNTTSTSTVGIRGLGAEDLAQAQPNMAALTQVEGMRQDANQARRFGTDANLRTRQVDALPAPAAPAAAKSQPNQRYAQ